MKRKIVALTLALGSALAFALPSAQDVENAVKAGNYAQADSMMQEVVAAKPQSAKAHYFYARILAHEGKFPEAAAQAQAAQGIDPAIGFTDPKQFQSFQQEVLRAEGAGNARMAPQAMAPAPLPMRHTGGGIPGWAWLLVLAFIGFLVLRAATRRSNPVMPGGAGFAGGQPGFPGGPAGYPGAGGPAYGPGYGVGPQPSVGGSMLGTGLAAAGGVAAGMMLERYLDDRQPNAMNPGNLASGFVPGVDPGALAAANDLENRPVDFGNDVAGGWGDDASSTPFTPDGGSGDGGGW